jgi:hypothetical protein
VLLADLSNGANGAGGQRYDAGSGYIPAGLETHDNLKSLLWDWNTYRNVYNVCPISPPDLSLGNMTCDGLKWTQDPSWWNGGAKWRSGNFECAWDSAGRVQPWTTYNYGASPASPVHWLLDWGAWQVNGVNGVPPAYLICP